MARMFLKRTLHGFIPADEAAAELVRKYKVGQVYRADVVRPRNYQHHKQMFALLQLTYQNLPERYAELWPTDRAFRRGLAEAIGHVDTYTTKDGEIKEVPLSLSYDDVPDEVDFTQLTARMMSVCAELLGIDEPELANEVAQFADYGVAA